MRISILLAGAAFAGGLTAAGAASAQTAGVIVLGNETAAAGFFGNLLAKNFPATNYMVGSDGETPFDPFGYGHDTSDGINFDNVPFVWTQAADSHWTQLFSPNGAPRQSWVLPSSTSCGNENEPQCEFVGHFVSPTPWVPLAIGTYAIMDEDGKTVSDYIRTWNNANGGNLLFASDPTGVPEPATWAMMILGVGALGLAARRRASSLAA